MKKGAFFWGQLGFTLVCSCFLLAPVVQTALTALTVDAFRGLGSGFTLRWLHKVLATYGDTIFRSFYLALATLVVCVLVGLPFAYALVRAGKARWASFIEESLVLPLSVPGIAIGLGILLTWGGLTWFRHSWLFLLAGHCIFCLPFMVRSVTAVLRVVPLPLYEEAAATLGADAFGRFRRIVVPIAGPGILSGALQVFTLSIGEFNLSWMLQTPFTRTLPVGLADTYASMRIEIGSAYTLIFLLLIVPVLTLMRKIPSLMARMTRRAETPDTLAVHTPVVMEYCGPASDLVSITLENCSKTFGRVRVLHSFSLHMPKGRKVVLLGPSGCGKTTTLRLIAGLESPDPGGKVSLGGKDVTRIPVEKRRVGMMFQQYALFPHMSVAENVAYGLRIRGTPRSETAKTVDDMLEMVRMRHLSGRGVSELSGGQRQRVALARALAVKPRVLLLDEPLASLDAILRVGVREELDRFLTSLGITTVLVTHDQDEAMSMGDLIVVMKDGRIEQIGSPQKIYHEPATAFVAGFVGGSNRLEGFLDADALRLPGGAVIPIEDLSVGRPRTGVSSLPARGKVSVFFRPNQARAAPLVPGRMRGRVVSAHFLGEKTRLVVWIAEETLIKMEIPPGETIPPGREIGVKLLPESLLLFGDAG
ncbi:MAG: ATP-binding cassette domain-containing protein [Candidatus Accumulibacter sp.]|jgi:putative spermidine/putrescine transport system ATP-binding protein|nr:ATP-binding cassette domain-containing protein [Accumulibacter sp.]